MVTGGQKPPEEEPEEEVTPEEFEFRRSVMTGDRYREMTGRARRLRKHIWCSTRVEYYFPNDELPEMLMPGEDVPECTRDDLLMVNFVCHNCTLQFDPAIMHSACSGVAHDFRVTAKLSDVIIEDHLKTTDDGADLPTGQYL